MVNQLHSGDKLHVLREHIRDESIDLICRWRRRPSPHFAPAPRIQILTIEGLMRGTERARYPDVAAAARTFKKARGEKQAVEQGNLFGAAEAADAKGRYRAGK